MCVILVFLFLLLYWYFLASASSARVLNEVECERWYIMCGRRGERNGGCQVQPQPQPQPPASCLHFGCQLTAASLLVFCSSLLFCCSHNYLPLLVCNVPVLRCNFHSFQGINMVLCFTICTVFHRQCLLCTRDSGSCMVLTVLSLSG